MTLLGATLVPHGLYIGSPGMQAASLDHTIWFHRPFRADEWWLYDQVTPSASGGRGLAIARVFSRDGRLVASVAQEGLIRMHEPKQLTGRVVEPGQAVRARPTRCGAPLPGLVSEKSSPRDPSVRRPATRRRPCRAGRSAS